MILSLASKGPINLRHLLSLGLFNNKQTGSRRMRSLVKRRKLYHIGKLYLDGVCDQREEFWCKRSIKLSNREHEAFTMEVVLCYHEHDAVTGPNVDQKLLPDATVKIGANTFHIEMHMGTMDRSQVQARWKKYEGCTDTILVVCRDEESLLDMMRWSKSLGQLVYFSTVVQVRSDPYGRVWRGLDGVLKAVDKGAYAGGATVSTQ